MELMRPKKFMNDNHVTIQVNGKGFIKEMMIYVIADRLDDFEGEYHFFIDDKEVDPADYMEEYDIIEGDIDEDE